MRQRRAWTAAQLPLRAIVLICLAAVPACAPSRTPASAADGAPAGELEIPPRPADAEQEASYYEARATALAGGDAREIERTDFVRFRRGRLYARGAALSEDEQTLQSEIRSVVEEQDLEAVSELARQMLALEPSDILSHMLRGVSLQRLERAPEAEFHIEMVRALLRSFLENGDGLSFDSAWATFRVKDEYDLLRALNCMPESQAFVVREGRSFDVLEARRLETGEVITLYFDVTELFAETQRGLQPKPKPKPAKQSPQPPNRGLPGPPTRRLRLMASYPS